MKTHTLVGGGLALAGALALTPSCAIEQDGGLSAETSIADPAPSTGGYTGPDGFAEVEVPRAGATATGQTPGTGGGPSPGGTESSTGGASPTGGDAASGGSPTSGGTSTTGGDPGSSRGGDAGESPSLPGCPASEPGEGSPCDASDGDFECTYESTTCSCASSASSDVWTCEETCPGNPPNNRDECSTRNQTCTYGNNECTCDAFGLDTRWSCTNPDCPSYRPGEGTGCSEPGLTCSFFMGSGSCTCQDEHWNCE